MAEAVPSPCISICTLDASGDICLGCGRSLDEIGEWGLASPERQRAIVQAAETRLAGKAAA